MEHVTIISQEAITKGLWWPPCIVGVISSVFIIWTLILCFKHINNGEVYSTDDRPMRLLTHAAVCIPLLFVVMLICSIFFPVETGQYKYEGTFDPEMTIVEFEEFQQQYSNVRFEDGVWKWEDKE